MDKLGIINDALMKTGLPLAASLEDCDWNAQTAYERVVDQTLRGFAWGFAQKFVTLAQSRDAPPHGFNYAYAMPTDCGRIIDLHCQFDLRSPQARYAVAGRNIYANVSPCHIRYVRKGVPPEEWPADFADAVAYKLAADIAALSAQTSQLTQGLLQLYQYALGQAQSVDAFERTERVPLDENIYMAARVGYSQENNGGGSR